MRHCTNCDAPLTCGYVFAAGEHYACDDDYCRDLVAKVHYESTWDELRGEDEAQNVEGSDFYWTQWEEDEDDDPYDMRKPRTELKSQGYFTDLLWQNHDVQAWYNVSDEEAQEILRLTMTNETVMTTIWDVIRIIAEERGHTRK